MTAVSLERRPRCACVILNYRTPKLTADCLDSLAAQRDDWPELVPVVVDNASGDGSAERIAAHAEARGYADWLHLIRASANRGFSAGNNLGIRAVEADVYWLLNSDTLVRPGACAELLRALEARPDAGLIGPRLEWPDGQPQESCFRFLRPPTEIVRAAWTGPVTRLLKRYEPSIRIEEAPSEPEWISFASVLIRRAVFDRVGYLDEGYFMYYEDTDFCRRARAAGFLIVCWPAAHVVHLRGQSGPVQRSSVERRRRPAYYYAARSRYYAKFHGRFGLTLANLGWLTGHAVAAIRRLVDGRPTPTCTGEARDIWTNWHSPMRPWPAPGPAAEAHPPAPSADPGQGPKRRDPETCAPTSSSSAP